MKGGLVVLAVIAVLVLAVGGWVVANYNNLVTKKTEVEESFVEIGNLQLRRNDMVPNLVETVKGVAAQEQAVFGQIADARKQLAGAGSTEQKIAAGTAMDSAIGGLLVVIDNYPQLRSQENFLRLQDALAGTQHRLEESCTRYNDLVGEYNMMVKRFPTNLFAGMFGYKEQPFYRVSAEQKQAPSFELPAAPGAQQAPPAGDK